MVRVKDLALMACLMITMAVTTADIEFWRFAQVQKSNLGRLIGVYTDGLSAQALVRGEARAVSDALDGTQGTRQTGVERTTQSWRFLTGRSSTIYWNLSPS